MQNFKGIEHALAVEMTTSSQNLQEFWCVSSAQNISKDAPECTKFFGLITCNMTWEAPCKPSGKSNMPWLLKRPHLPGTYQNFDVQVQCRIFRLKRALSFLDRSHTIWLKSLHAKFQGHRTCPDCWNEHSFLALAAILSIQSSPHYSQ
jgi:hypothetical protein